MALRLLFGMLASAAHDYSEVSETPDKVFLGLPEEWRHINKAAEEQVYVTTYAGYIQEASKFHIGMLTISLLVGLGYAGYVTYMYLMEKDVFLGYIRNLVIALVCRTFFTVIFDGVVILGWPPSVGGANTLSAFEQICLNLVLAFWLCLTVYAHARVQRNFKSEPTMRLYQYGIPVVAVFFAFIWIFTLQDLRPNFVWWLILNPFTQWIVNSANLLFLLVQLGLVVDMCRMMISIKASLDNDSISLLWKVAAMMGALVLIFWLHLGLSLGPYKSNPSYLNFFYFIDGIEATLVCACLYFFYRWVTLLNSKSCLVSGSGHTLVSTAEAKRTELLPDRRGIVTVDSIFVTRESGRWKTSEEEDSKDVLYSNVVEPNRLQKTLELYKRLNVIPSQVTVVEGEQFFDCQIPAEQDTVNRKLSQRSIARGENLKLKNEKMIEPIQKKNAFYTSKYLILDPKESEIPKYLETRPSVSSVSEKDSQKDDQIGRTDFFPALEGKELVRLWLNDNSENMGKSNKTPSIEHKELSRANSDSTKSKPLVREVDNLDKPLTGADLSKTENRLQPLDAAEHGVPSENVADTPTKTNEAEANDKPTEPPKPFLTYSELLEFRSKRDKSDERTVSKHSLSDSIFSKLDLLINASGSLLNSLTGYAQAEHKADEDFRLNDRLFPDETKFKTGELHEETNKMKQDPAADERVTKQPQLEYEPKKQTEEKLKEDIQPKLHSDLIPSSLPEKPIAEQREDTPICYERKEIEGTEGEKPTAVQPEDDPIRPESKERGDVEGEKPTAEQPEEDPIRPENKEVRAPERKKWKPTLKNEIKYDNFENGMIIQSLQEPSLISGIVQPPHRPIHDKEEETSSDSEFSIEKRQSYKQLTRLSHNYPLSVTADLSKAQLQAFETPEREQSSSSSSESFSLEQYCTNVMNVKAMLESQQSPLKFNKNSQ